MKEERNALQREVFPKLRKVCMEHGFRFQAIDLRWGVSEEAGLDQQTMKICLEEIERSQRVSPKPNFIVLLGNRYGWRPLPYEIPADEFDEIKKVVSHSDKDFLFWQGDILEDEELRKREGWYCLDENAVPPVYCLKPRFVDYVEKDSDEEIKKARDLEYGDWETIEKRLKSILLNAINDLGWDYEDPRRFKYESSATEQEIIKGVLKLPEDGSLSEEHVFSFMRTIKYKKSILFDDNSKDFFDFNENKELDSSAEEKLIALKAKIDDKLPSFNIFDYETEWEGKGVNKQHIKKLCTDVYSSLEKVINEQIDEFEDKDPLDIEIEAHKEFGEERCKFFIGREDNRAQIKNYLENPNPKPLIVYGESGSGKSALMAQAVEDLHPNFYKTPVDNIIVRFIGATPESSNMRSLLESLSKQISLIYGEDDSIPSDYNELVQHFKERLNLANDGKPLLIFLDALDQLSDSDSAHNLTWLPDELPENVHIVISTLKNIFQFSLEHRYVDNTVEVLPLEKNDARNILEAWFNDNKRKLTNEQENKIISKFEVEGLPLYLKLAFEESKLWKSYTPIPKFQSDIIWMINSLFERLSRPENHGEMLVSRSLSYLSAAKNGLTEDEMLDILALDDNVFDLTKKFHDPKEKKLPVAVWSRLYFDLEPYLTERSADETSLLAFYHRQLGEVAKEKYLDNTVKTTRHQLIAEYFYKQDLYFEQDEERVYNVRKVSELPYNETYGGLWDRLEETLTDLYFIEAKCAIGRTYELINDYNLALNQLPEAQEENRKKREHEESVEKYTQDLIAYGKGEIQTLEIIPSVRLWTEEEIIKDTERIINNPTRLDRIEVFFQFVNSQSHRLFEFGSITGFCLQQAYNSANSGPVAETAREIINEYSQNPLFLKYKQYNPEFNPHPLLTKTLVGHKNWVESVAVTADGKRAVSGSCDCTVRLWDLETGANLKTLEGHNRDITAVAVTPDGKRAVSGSMDKTLRVWDLETGENLKTLEGHDGYVRAVAVTADGKKATVSTEYNMFVWDLENGKTIETLEGHWNSIVAIDVTPDGKRAVSGRNDSNVYVWDIGTDNHIKTLEVHPGIVTALTVTPDGKRIITGSGKNVFVWDLETRENIRTIEGQFIESLAVTADGKRAVSGSIDNKVRVLDLETGENLKTLEGHVDTVRAVAVTADGKRAVSGSMDKTVRVWDLETGNNRKIFQNHNNNLMDVKDVVVTADGKRAITLSDNHTTVSVWDFETGENLKTLEGHKTSVNVVAVTPDGKRIITGSGKNVFVWDLETGAHLKTLEGHVDTVRAVAVTPDGKRIITGSGKNVFVWDLETGAHLKTLEGHTSSVDVVVITADGKRVISGSHDTTVRVWDLETGAHLKTLEGHTSSVDVVVITADGKRVISGSYADYIYNHHSLCVWDLETGENLKILKHPPHSKLMAVAVTPDGKRIITGSGKNVFVWDLETGASLKIIEHKHRVKAVAVTPDGKRAISISLDQNVNFWDLETGELISISNEDYYFTYMHDTTFSFLTVKADGRFVVIRSGDVVFSRFVNIMSSLPLLTATNIGLHNRKRVSDSWENFIKADCRWCGNRFNVAVEIINTISEIENQYKKPNGWISDEAWDDSRLISECPECHQKIKFNPFVVDNSEEEFEKEINNDECPQNGSEAPDEDLNKPKLIIDDKIEIFKEKKKSRWKFWK